MAKLIEQGRKSEAHEVRPLHFSVFGEPTDRLQAAVIGGLQESLQRRGAVFQEQPDKQTQLVLVPSKFGEDVDIKDLPYRVFRKRIDTYQVKFANITTVSSVPDDISELQSKYLAQVLDMPRGINLFGHRIAFGPLASVLDRFNGHWDQEELVQLANKRGLSPAVALGYPQIPRVGCSYVVMAVGDHNSNSPEDGFLIGLEQSHPRLGVKKPFSEDLAERFKAHAGDHLIIANQTLRGSVLPREVWLESTGPKEIIEHGVLMKEWNLIPPQFPIGRFTGFRKKRYYDRVLEVVGISYGNMSRRASEKEREYGVKFWMSKSGARKDGLRPEDVFAITGLIEGQYVMGRIPIQGVKQVGRASVDSIEAEKIYDMFAEIGATAHGHRWLINPKTGRPFEKFDGFEQLGDTYIVCTDEQHLCGSIELGDTTTAAIAQSPNPAKTLVLQKRHGFQGVGEDFDELFGRLETLRYLMTSEIPQN